MKKTIATLMSLTAACAMFTPAFAVETESPTLISKPPAVISEAPEETTGRYTFEINGKDVPVDAVIIVPLRTIAEQLGFTVTWNGDGTVTVDSGEMHTTITIGEDSYQAITSIEGAVGATAPLSLGAAPYVVDGTTYVPLEMFNVLLGNGAVDLEDGKIVINSHQRFGRHWSSRAARREKDHDCARPAHLFGSARRLRTRASSRPTSGRHPKRWSR